MKFALKWLLPVLVLCFPLFSEAAVAIEQLQAFLQSTRTFKADFVQAVVARGGRKPQESSGNVAILRPSKLRWEIRKPYPQLIVGDGEKIWIHDQDLNQVTVRKAGQAISGSPAALLSGKNELERDFVLGEAGNADGLAWVEAVPKQKESGFEKVRLGFSGGDLKAMELHDSFGQTTHIRFTNLQRNIVLPDSTFRFVPPPGVDVVGE